MNKSGLKRLAEYTIDEQPEVQHVANALERVIDEFSIEPASFRNEPRDVVEGTMRFLEYFEVNKNLENLATFFGHKDKVLLALAVVDEWLCEETTLEDKKNLLQCFKTIMLSEIYDKTYGRYTYDTFSPHIFRMGYSSRKGLSELAYPYSPIEWKSKPIPTITVENDTYILEGVHPDNISFQLSRYISMFRHPEASEILNNIARRWGSGTVLGHVRTQLNMSQENELPFVITVVNRSLQQFAKDLRASGGFFIQHTIDGEVRHILLNAAPTKLLLEHEYVHAQINSSNIIGSDHLSFVGLQEALTENVISEPVTYAPQRAVLNAVFNFDSNYRALMHNAYLGDTFERETLYTTLIKDFGLQGFLTLARLSPYSFSNPNDKYSSYEPFYINPTFVLKFFESKNPTSSEL